MGRAQVVVGALRKRYAQLRGSANITIGKFRKAAGRQRRPSTSVAALSGTIGSGDNAQGVPSVGPLEDNSIVLAHTNVGVVLAIDDVMTGPTGSKVYLRDSSMGRQAEMVVGRAGTHAIPAAGRADGLDLGAQAHGPRHTSIGRIVERLVGIRSTRSTSIRLVHSSFMKIEALVAVRFGGHAFRVRTVCIKLLGLVARRTAGSTLGRIQGNDLVPLRAHGTSLSPRGFLVGTLWTGRALQIRRWGQGGAQLLPRRTAGSVGHTGSAGGILGRTVASSGTRGVRRGIAVHERFPKRIAGGGIFRVRRTGFCAGVLVGYRATLCSSCFGIASEPCFSRATSLAGTSIGIMIRRTATYGIRRSSTGRQLHFRGSIAHRVRYALDIVRGPCARGTSSALIRVGPRLEITSLACITGMVHGTVSVLVQLRRLWASGPVTSAGIRVGAGLESKGRLNARF